MRWWEFKRSTKLKLNDEHEFFFKAFTRFGGILVYSVLDLISDSETLKLKFDRHEEGKKSEEQPDRMRYSSEAHPMIYQERSSAIVDMFLLDDLLKHGCVMKTENGYAVDKRFERLALAFKKFLLSKDYAKDYEDLDYAVHTSGDIKPETHPDKS